VEIASLNAKVKTLMESQAESEGTISGLKERILKLTEERDELQSNDPSAISQEIYKLQKEVSTLTSDLRDYEKLKEELTKAKNQIQRQTTELEDLNRERDHSNRRLERLVRENKELLEEINSLKQQIEKLHGIEQELRTIRSDKSNLDLELLQLSSVKDDHNNLKRLHAVLAKEKEELLRQIDEKQAKMTIVDSIRSENEQ